MSCLWTIISLSFIFLSLSEAKHQNKLHSAVVVGTVYCDTCFHQDFSKASHFISGASVAVECEDTGSRPGFRQEVKTDEHGEFKLIRSGEPYCAVAATATSSSLHLKSRKEGTHIFSAGFFTFKPLKQPELCDQKPIIKNSKDLDSVKSLISNPNDPTFAPPIQDPPSDPPALGQILPPLPQLPNLPPLPRLPNLPPLPGMPNLPPAVPKKATAKDSAKPSELMDKKVTDLLFFPPNPLNPPILPIPPNPLLPPPSILPIPPNPLLPPPSILPIPPNPLAATTIYSSNSSQPLAATAIYTSSNCPFAAPFNISSNTRFNSISTATRADASICSSPSISLPTNTRLPRSATG
ncbi:vegetative cell wall protein gp1-like [Abeliophyllum distichum]|uniref:Vegetative cell wall protein gp1-like n=1 Tax=Abeliophyllum distichum TaxID=126358 RepID=A0ABD1SJH6_9LAMI